MSKTVKINFTLNNQNFKKVLQISKTEVEDGGIVTVFDVEEFKVQIKKIQISGDVNCDEFCKIITESFNVTVNKRAYISECEIEIEVKVKEEVKEITEAKTEENQDSEDSEIEEIEVFEVFEVFEVNGIHCIEKEVAEIEIKNEVKNEVKNDMIFDNCFDYMVEIESSIKEESQKQADKFQEFYAENGEEGMCFYNKIFQKELSVLALLRQELFCVKSFMKSI